MRYCGAIPFELWEDSQLVISYDMYGNGSYRLNPTYTLGNTEPLVAK